MQNDLLSKVFSADPINENQVLILVDAKKLEQKGNEDLMNFGARDFISRLPYEEPFGNKLERAKDFIKNNIQIKVPYLMLGLDGSIFNMEGNHRFRAMKELFNNKAVVSVSKLDYEICKKQEWFILECNEYLMKQRESNLQDFMKDSIFVDTNSNPIVMFHGTIADIKEFDKNKIRINDYDVPYNGFWFSSDPDTTPAMRDATNVIPVYLDVKNPITRKEAIKYSKRAREILDEKYKEIASEVGEENYDAQNERFESFLKSINIRGLGDLTRKLIQEDGYDAIIHLQSPKINKNVFEKEMREKGEYIYESVSGYKYQLKYDSEGYLDLNELNGENITGYENLEEFVRLHSDNEYVVFEPNQIKSVFDVKFDKTNNLLNERDVQKSHPNNLLQERKNIISKARKER